MTQHDPGRPGDPEPVRIGLIGFGLAGAAFHAPVIESTSGLRLRAIVTSDAERAERARQRFPAATVVPDLESLLRMREALDVVVVATPNRTHVALARAALEAGLGAVVDKPLAPTRAEAAALVQEAAQRGLFFTTYHNRRWDGDFRTLQRLVREGRLGRVLRMESRFERWRPQPKPGWRERGDPGEAGGILFDLGPHLVDQARVLLGPVVRVYAEVARRRPGVEVDDDAFLALTHASGATSHLWTSAVAGQVGPRFRVLGSEAAYVKHGLDVQEERLRAGARVGGAGWGEEPPESWGVLAAGDRVEPVPTLAGDYRGFYEGVYRSIRRGEPPPIDPMDAVRGLGILEAAFRSARDGETVELPEG